MELPGAGTFIVGLVVSVASSVVVFSHADRHGSRHPTAWGVTAFLFALVGVPLSPPSSEQPTTSASPPAPMSTSISRRLSSLPIRTSSLSTGASCRAVRVAHRTAVARPGRLRSHYRC